MRVLLVCILSLSNLVFAQSSVSWKTSKTMFLFSDQTPIGINNSVRVETGYGEARFIKLIIPIASFSSGEAERDQEVQKILKADIQPNIIFQTELMKQAEYERLLSGDVREITGNLNIANESHPVTVKLALTNNFLVGTVDSKFTTFGITPPKVAGGLVAKVHDKLELVGRIDLEDLKK
ncbi:MAG: hypothetical protein CME65_08425 [Halobacteriovoraceae bacterium]|nr:hypothetical protein [Halobacteriovoraceae bacterium]|tara:strand:- start:1164 stop:1700 length:537 start_codon:yes stop_codon:yes gene_type:complete